VANTASTNSFHPEYGLIKKPETTDKRKATAQNAAGGPELLTNQQFKGETALDDVAKTDKERHKNQQRWFDVLGHVDTSCIRDVYSLQIFVLNF
jgi:hypothetical protein